jgi:hypothetical protein
VKDCQFLQYEWVTMPRTEGREIQGGGASKAIKKLGCEKYATAKIKLVNTILIGHSSYRVVILTINTILTNYFLTHLLVYHMRFSHQVAILSGSKKLIIWFTIW